MLKNFVSQIVIISSCIISSLISTQTSAVGGGNFDPNNRDAIIIKYSSITAGSLMSYLYANKEYGSPILPAAHVIARAVVRASPFFFFNYFKSQPLNGALGQFAKSHILTTCLMSLIETYNEDVNPESNEEKGITVKLSQNDSGIIKTIYLDANNEEDAIIALQSFEKNNEYVNAIVFNSANLLNETFLNYVDNTFPNLKVLALNTLNLNSMLSRKEKDLKYIEKIKMTDGTNKRRFSEKALVNFAKKNPQTTIILTYKPSQVLFIQVGNWLSNLQSIEYTNADMADLKKKIPQLNFKAACDSSDFLVHFFKIPAGAFAMCRVLMNRSLATFLGGFITSAEGIIDLYAESFMCPS